MITYADFIDAMIEAQKQGFTKDQIEKACLTDESRENFLNDDSFTKEVEKKQDNQLGTDWMVKIEPADEDYLLMTTGEKITI